MKANELMIGDWVYVSKNFTQKYHKIRALSNDEGAVLRGIYVNEYGVENNSVFSPNDTDPIPITPEILEKNGFKKNKTGQWVIEKKHSIGCCGQTCSNTNPLEYAVWWDKFGLGCVSYLEKEGNITLGGTTYVHQLQQILRLFDLDKFIKIEL